MLRKLKATKEGNNKSSSSTASSLRAQSMAASNDDVKSYVSKKSTDSKRSLFSIGTSASKQINYEPPLPLSRMNSCSSFSNQRQDSYITNTCPTFNYMDFIGYQLDGYCLRDARDAFICQSCYSRYIEKTPVQLLVKPCKAYPFITQGCFFSCLSSITFWEQNIITSFKSPENLLNNLDLFCDHLRAIHSTQCFHETITENNYESSKIYYNPSNDLYACDGCYQQQLKFSPFAEKFLLLEGKDILRTNVHSTSIKTKCSFINSEVSSAFKYYSKVKNEYKFNYDISHLSALRSNPMSEAHQTDKFYYLKDTNVCFCEICYYSFFKYWPDLFEDKFDISVREEVDRCFCHTYDLYFQLTLYSREWTISKFETFLESCSRAILAPACGLQTRHYFQLEDQEFVVCARCYETKCKIIFDIMPALKFTYKNPRNPGFCALNIHFPKYRVGYRNFQNQLKLMQCFSNGSSTSKKLSESTYPEVVQAKEKGTEFADFFKCITGVATCSFFERGVRGDVFYKFNINDNGKYPIGCCRYCYLTIVKNTFLEDYFTAVPNTNMKQNACFLSMAELQNQYFIACELGQPEMFLRFYYFLHQQLLQTEAILRLKGSSKMVYFPSDVRIINDFHSEFIDKGHPITAATNVYFKSLLNFKEDSTMLKKPQRAGSLRSTKATVSAKSTKSNFILKRKNKKNTERDVGGKLNSSSSSIKSNKSSFHNKLKFF